MLSRSARICLFVAACLLFAPAAGASSTGGTSAPEPSGGGVGAEPLPPVAPDDGTAAQDEVIPTVPEEEAQGEDEGEQEDDDGEVVIPVPVPEDEDDTTTTPPEAPASTPDAGGGGFSFGLASTGLAVAGPVAAALLFLLAGVALARRRRA